MRNLLMVLTAVGFLGSVAAEEAKPVAPAKGPRIRVEPASFDFGRAVTNRTLQKEFTVRNFGNEDLVIEAVTTTCGCTAALTESKTVKPGGATPLRVTFETRSYSGRVEREVLIRSNDSTAGVFKVKIEATVVPEK